VKRVYHSNYACYGVRKMWRELKLQTIDVGRDQVARLMRSAGLRGATRQRRVRTTMPAPAATPAPDLVRRKWSRDAPDVVWVADFTYVLTRQGWVFTSFLQDAYSRFILGHTISSSMSTALVISVVEQAVSVRKRSNPTFMAQGVICHSDHGSQFTSLAFGQKLIEHGINPSMGRVGSAYDNALMESTIGLYKTELIHPQPRRVWSSRQEVETATTAWVRWFNHKRLHSAIAYHSPATFEAAYHETLDLPRQAA